MLGSEGDKEGGREGGREGSQSLVYCWHVCVSYITISFWKRGQSKVKVSYSPPSPQTLIPYFLCCTTSPLISTAIQLTPSPVHTLTSSPLTSSHFHQFTSSPVHLSPVHTLTSSHPHQFTPSPVHLSPVHTLTSSHPPQFTPSPVHTLTSSHPHQFTSHQFTQLRIKLFDGFSQVLIWSQTCVSTL